jgi:hypothetical protein
MFDYLTDRDGRTLYGPAPAWPTIADENNTADEADYMRIGSSAPHDLSLSGPLLPRVQLLVGQQQG